MVTAPSNGACDEIATRLLDVLDPGQVFRLYAKSMKIDRISEELKEISNLQDGEFIFPSLEYVYQYRVVVATLSTIGTLVRARGEDPTFDSSHFARLFIDEAACCHEPSALIPIAGPFFEKNSLL